MFIALMKEASGAARRAGLKLNGQRLVAFRPAEPRLVTSLT